MMTPDNMKASDNLLHIMYELISLVLSTSDLHVWWNDALGSHFQGALGFGHDHFPVGKSWDQEGNLLAWAWLQFHTVTLWSNPFHGPHGYSPVQQDDCHFRTLPKIRIPQHSARVPFREQGMVGGAYVRLPRYGHQWFFSESLLGILLLFLSFQHLPPLNLVPLTGFFSWHCTL